MRGTRALIGILLVFASDGAARAPRRAAGGTALLNAACTADADCATATAAFSPSPSAAPTGTRSLSPASTPSPAPTTSAPPSPSARFSKFASASASAAASPSRATGSLRPSPSASSSGTASPSATATKTRVVCGAGLFLLPGDATQACRPCAAGTFSAAAGLVGSGCPPCANATYANATGSTACAPAPAGFRVVAGLALPCGAGQVSAAGAGVCTACAARGSAPNAARAQCVDCPVGSFDDGDACRPCAAGTYCAGRANAPILCSPPEACNGTSCVEALGYVRDAPRCNVCIVGYYRTSPSGCAKCESQVWLVIVGGIMFICAGLTAAALSERLKPLMATTGAFLQRHSLALYLLQDQVTRLTLLSRLSTLPLPPAFKSGTAVVGGIAGLDTSSLGLECANIKWTFQQSYGIVVGAGVLFAFTALVVDVTTLCEGTLRIGVAQWLVFDAIELFLPFVLQSSAQAVSWVWLPGAQPATRVLFYDRATDWDAAPYVYARNFAGVVIAFAFCFMCARIVLALSLPRPDRRGDGALRLRPDLLAPHKTRTGKRTRVLLVARPSVSETFLIVARPLLAYFRTASIWFETFERPLVPALFLLALNAAESAALVFAMLVQRRKAARAASRVAAGEPEGAGAHGLVATAFVVFVFTLTHAVAVVCAAQPGGQCRDGTSAALAAVLILANLALFAVLAMNPLADALGGVAWRRAAPLAAAKLQSAASEGSARHDHMPEIYELDPDVTPRKCPAFLRRRCPARAQQWCARRFKFAVLYKGKMVFAEHDYRDSPADVAAADAAEAAARAAAAALPAVSQANPFHAALALGAPPEGVGLAGGPGGLPGAAEGGDAAPRPALARAGSSRVLFAPTASPSPGGLVLRAAGGGRGLPQ